MGMRAVLRIGGSTLILLCCGPPAWAEESNTSSDTLRLEETVVYGRSENLVGIAPAASMGRVGQAQLEPVPLLRTGEVLERVPGLIATQHSGTGKANQFFLRGFNLDHGTDFSAFVEGVPLNMPTHAHGQGYLDVNSIIPELIEVLEFRKGPYYADVGDFSSAGTSSIDYVRRLERPFATVEIGQYDFYRVVGAGSPRIAGGDLLLAGEMNFYNGPWDLQEDLDKFNGLAKWTWGDDERGFSLLASGYSADWNSTDQVARRAVDGSLEDVNGINLDRLGYIDPDLGGESSRYTGSARFWNGARNTTRASAYVVFYDLDLWSNFTYFLDDPENGDEFQQKDRRVIVGLDLSQDYHHEVASIPIHHLFGVQVRRDIITDVGLFHTVARDQIGTVREDSVNETNLGMYWQGDAQLLSWMRAYVGVRGNVFWFDVDGRADTDGDPPPQIPDISEQNSGNAVEGIASPKVGLAFGPWASTEIYLNYGRGFHSNDARGTTIQVDPSTGEPADKVDPLVATQGAEIGTRSTWVPGLQSTLGFWWLDLDSELLFIGDAGNTEATRPSRRYGIEFANYYNVLPWLTLDADFTFTHSEFRDHEPEIGDDIPGAIETTVAAGAAVDFDNGLFGSLRVRHFGARPLVEDGSKESDPTTLVNLRTGWHYRKFPWGDLTFAVDILNLLDSHDDDITYYYASRLPNEPAEGVEDYHFHPVEPRMVRGSITFRY